MNQKSGKKVLVVFGTRPEAVKLAPVINKLREEEGIHTTVCVFRQHEKMLDQTLRALDIRPDCRLPVSLSDRALFGGRDFLKKPFVLLKSGMGFLRFVILLKRLRPDLLVVQGDTSTAYLAAWVAFHLKIRIAHVEAGLRTGNKYAPFPEEMNRVLIARLADFHFAPTERARENLLREGVREDAIHVVGNTAIDALKHVLGKGAGEHPEGVSWGEGKKLVLVTAHRRESFGEGLRQICAALKEIAEARKDTEIIFPMHDNPNVSRVVKAELAEREGITLIDPLPYDAMIHLMSRSYLILTDSGGIQEEAPSLGVPVLVMRDETERLEGVRAGVSRMVGTRKENIVRAVWELLDDPDARDRMRGDNPYGDGRSAARIVAVCKRYLKL